MGFNTFVSKEKQFRPKCIRFGRIGDGGEPLDDPHETAKTLDDDLQKLGCYDDNLAFESSLLHQFGASRLVFLEFSFECHTLQAQMCSPCVYGIGFRIECMRV